MEEQEKIDLREHLIGWIDTLLKDGIVPQVVNPKAIRANYIRKSKIKEKIEPIIDSLEKDGFVGYADEIRDIVSELMEDK